jgi:hypothetical protein
LSGEEEQLSTLGFADWQKACRNALLERDPEKLFQRVIVAETAIFHRLHDDMASGPEHTELEAMAGMLKTLRRLLATTFTLADGRRKSNEATSALCIERTQARNIRREEKGKEKSCS